jgi:hypothetical protein
MGFFKFCDSFCIKQLCFFKNSDVDHQQSDWFGIHEKICQSLIPLRANLPFLPSEEERKKRDLDLKNKKVC